MLRECPLRMLQFLTHPFLLFPQEFIELLSSTVFNEKIYQLVQIPKRKKVKSVADITSGVYVCTTKSLGEAVDTSVKYKTLPVKVSPLDQNVMVFFFFSEREKRNERCVYVCETRCLGIIGCIL